MTTLRDEPPPQKLEQDTSAFLYEVATKLCAAEVASISEAGAGANSRILKVISKGKCYALKFYRDGAVERCGRLIAETSALKFLEENQVAAVPRLISMDSEANCALLEWVNGSTITSIGISDIENACTFIETLHDLRKAKNAAQISPGVDQCLSGADVVAQLEARLERLKHSDDPGLRNFLADRFVSLMAEVEDWSTKSFETVGLSFSQKIERSKQTLSPVDFGLHNAIRQEDGSIVFIDFEYFGWADPTQVVVDTIQHPGMSTTYDDRQMFLSRCNRFYSWNPDYGDRVKYLFPLFGLRWCTIMLNAFLPQYHRPGNQYPHGLNLIQFRKHQFEQVVKRVDEIQQTFRTFPYSQS